VATYVYDNVEVKKTGRQAERALRAGKEDVIFEITPVDQRDGTWRKWVRDADLYFMKQEGGHQ
jgi:hypothetical protein